MELIGVSWGEVFDFADVLAFAGKLVITGIAFCVLNQLMLRIEINKYVSMLISAGGFCCLNLCINIKRIGKVLKEVNALRM